MSEKEKFNRSIYVLAKMKKILKWTGIIIFAVLMFQVVSGEMELYLMVAFPVAWFMVGIQACAILIGRDSRYVKGLWNQEMDYWHYVSTSPDPSCTREYQNDSVEGMALRTGILMQLAGFAGYGRMISAAYTYFTLKSQYAN